MNDHHQEEVGITPNFVWENTEDHIGFFHDERPFSPVIYEGPFCEIDPRKYNGLCIHLRAGLVDDLNWAEEIDCARKAIKNGMCIIWFLDFGLSSSIKLPLSDDSQFMSFQIALDHFSQTIWKEFSSSSIGVCLFKGSADFTSLYSGTDDEEKSFHEWMEDHPNLSNENQHHLLNLFCRERLVDYLNFLASALPVEANLFLLWDCTLLSDQAMKLQICAGEALSRFHLVLKNGIKQLGYLDWEQCVISHPVDGKPARLGLFVPSISLSPLNDFQYFDPILNDLRRRQIKVRIIQEHLFTQQWQGLDELIIDPSIINPGIRRMINGFCAAGGTITQIP